MFRLAPKISEKSCRNLSISLYGRNIKKIHTRLILKEKRTEIWLYLQGWQLREIEKFEFYSLVPMRSIYRTEVARGRCFLNSSREGRSSLRAQTQSEQNMMEVLQVLAGAHMWSISVEKWASCVSCRAWIHPGWCWLTIQSWILQGDTHALEQLC